MKTTHLAALFGAFAFASLAIPAGAQEKELFRHVVCFQFKEDTTEQQHTELIGEFLELENKIDTIVDIEWGTSENVEPLNDGFTHCILVTFKNKAGLEVYLPHPAHKAFVEILKPHLEKVFVFDYTPQG